MNDVSDFEGRLKLADELLSFSDAESTRGRSPSAEIMRRAGAAVRADALLISALQNQIDDVRKALKMALSLTSGDR